jgi:hypothetical protein
MSTNPLFPPPSETRWGFGDGSATTHTYRYRTPGTYPLHMAISVPGHGAIPLTPAPGGRFVLPRMPRKLKKHLQRAHGVGS